MHDPALSAALEGPPTRVLVVDDNRDAADVLALGLEKRGYEARVAYDGRTALAVIERESPRIALLDIDLPDMNGFEIARQVRREHGAGIELVAVTGWGDDRDREYAMQAGFDHHFTKPVRLSQLVEYLRSIGAPSVVGREPEDVAGDAAN